MRNVYRSLQKMNIITKKIKSIFSIIFCLMITGLLLSGCGGGGGDPAPVTPPTSHTPVISNLQYSPQSVTQNQGNGEVTITGAINFTDQGGDIKTVTLNAYTAQGMLQGVPLDTQTSQTQGLSGVVSGVYSGTVVFNTTTVGNFIIEIYLTDSVGNKSNKLSGTFSVTTSPIPPPLPSEALIGNFKFVYNILSTLTDRITLNSKSSLKTSDNTDVYTGYNADYPTVTTAVGAWYPSISQYIIVKGITGSIAANQWYNFTINNNNTLSGCTNLTIGGNCYSFILPTSHKSSLGSWEMSTESQNEPRDINEVFENKMYEDQEAKAQRTESASPVDADIVSKINELTAIIEKNR